MWTCSKCGEKIEESFEVCWSCGTSQDGKEDPNFWQEETDRGPENEPYPANVPQGETDMVTVTSCLYAHEAHAIKVHLEAEGLAVFLADELTVAMDWLVANAIGGIKVQVPAAQAKKAVALLLEMGHKIPAPEESDTEETDTEEDLEIEEPTSPKKSNAIQDAEASRRLVVKKRTAPANPSQEVRAPRRLGDSENPEK